MKAEVLQQLAERRPSWGLPGGFYHDPGIYQLDLEQIWYRNWLFVGHDLEVPQRGDCLRVDIGERSILIVNTGEDLAAFDNRFPGLSAPLFAGSTGSVKRFHHEGEGRDYQLDGQCLTPGAPALQRLPLVCLSHFLFLSLSENPSDMSEFRELLTPYMAPHCRHPLKIAHQSSIIEQGNWKLVLENNRECYHCLSNHPGLIITFPEDPSISGSNPHAALPAMVEEHWQRCEAAGLPSRFRIAESGDYRVTRMPLLKNFSSYTMDGQDAVGKRLLTDSDTNAGTLMLFHYPNSWNHCLGDHIISFRVLPLTVQSSRVITTWLVRADAEEGVDYDLNTLTEVWEATNDEDRYLVEQNQQGINSPLYRPGPYSRVYEDGVIQFVQWYSDTLNLRLNTPA